MTMMVYPARLRREGGGFVVSFPDIPEALTQGDTLEEAREMALDALVTALDFYFEDRRTVPMPSPIKRGQEPIALPVSVEVKVMLLNAMVSAGVRPAELARRMAVRPQEVTRLTDLHHATKIDTLAQALLALGHTLNVSLT